jgi:hypothetical protein
MIEPDLAEIIIVDWHCPYIIDCLEGLDGECQVGQRVHALTDDASFVGQMLGWKRLAIRATALTENLGFARADNQAVLEFRSE